MGSALDDISEWEAELSRGGASAGHYKTAARSGSFEAEGREIHLGASHVHRLFTSYGANLAQYACQKLCVKLGASAFMEYTDFASAPPQEFIQTDVDKREAVFANYMAQLPSLMVACTHVPSGLKIAAYARTEGEASKFFDQLDSEIWKSNFYRGKCLYFSSDGIEFQHTPTMTWDDVILSTELKDEILLNTAEFLGTRALHKRGILKRGMILHGPPGTGKTSVVRALFNMLGTGATRVYLTSEAFERFSMTEFFKMAQYLLPALVVFEDLDLIGTSRRLQRGGVIGSLLTQLDGVNKVKEPLVVVGTTNDMSAVDEALANRPSRFDRILLIPAPEPLEIHAFYKRFGGFAPTEDLVKASSGFTGSHIEETIKTATMLAERVGNGAKLEDYAMRAAGIIRKNFRSLSAAPKAAASDDRDFGGGYASPEKYFPPDRNPLEIDPSLKPNARGRY